MSRSQTKRVMARLARIFHQVAPVHELSASQNTDFLGANPKANLDRRGYAGLRGAGAAGLRSSARQCLRTLDCAPLAQPRSPLHPRNSRVPDEISGLERFAEVELDFADVSRIGQGFADELIRVWPMAHPQTQLKVTQANAEVTRMLEHVARRTDLPQPTRPVVISSIAL